MMTVSGVLAVLAAAGLSSAAASPPIVNPGAPGQPSRIISAEESVAMSRTGHTEADARFMRHMIVHHQQAVDMVDLIEGRSTHPGVRAIGRRISLSQDAEIELMSEWLMSRGEPVEADDLHDHHHHHAHHHADHHGADPREIPVMPGMLSPAQMDALAAASGAEFDRLFLEGMILHHQGAIDMVDALMAEPGNGEEPVLSDFLGSVIADQSSEILRMQSMLSEL